ncbi:MAG TPA: DUF4399 domain-containing protein [Steroidobacteraceae bacterium]|jgi:hypothetical protein|nr:DUF4399 domain-containing protein [Steroidobacteraceae bacterium]
MRIFAIAALGLIAVAAAWAQDRTPSAPGAEVYIIAPHSGQTVKSPVTVRFGLKGMGIAPAGVKFDNTGHHHLFIDTDLPTDMSKPLPTTDKILHFGKGQTEVTLDKDKLPPGKHTLQLVFGDLNHVPLNPPLVSKKITITVE